MPLGVGLAMTGRVIVQPVSRSHEPTAHALVLLFIRHPLTWSHPRLPQVNRLVSLDAIPSGPQRVSALSLTPKAPAHRGSCSAATHGISDAAAAASAGMSP